MDAAIRATTSADVVADEAKSALTLAKRAITAFIESDYDKLHLANLPATLRSIWGDSYSSKLTAMAKL